MGEIVLVVSFLFSVHLKGKDSELLPVELTCYEKNICVAKPIKVDDCKNIELIATKYSVKNEAKMPKNVVWPRARCLEGIVDFVGMP